MSGTTTDPAERHFRTRLALGALTAALTLYFLAVWPFAMAAKLLLPSDGNDQEPS